MKNEIIKFLLEAEEFDADFVKELSGPSQDELDVQLGRILPDVIRRKEEKLGRKHVRITQHTNPKGETFVFGFFGRGKGQVTATLLYLDPGKGWRPADDATFYESASPRIRGEYWITDSGVWFADGDVGDMNHEMYAVDHARRKILDAIGGNSEADFMDEDTFRDLMIEALEDKGVVVEDSRDWIKIAENYLSTAYPGDRAIQAIFRAACGFGDARDVAVEHFGWIWCRGNNLSTWTYDRELLLSGVSEVIEQEDDGATDWSSLDLEIYVASRKRHYSITYGDLESGGNPTQDFTWPVIESEDGEDDTDFKDVYPDDGYGRYVPMGSISRGTVDPDHLIPRLIDVVRRVDPNKADNLQLEFEYLLTPEERGAFLWEKMYDVLNEYTPPYTYFGTHEGDSSDFGVWPDREAVENWLRSPEDIPPGEQTELIKLVPGEPIRPGQSRYVVKLNEYDYPVELYSGETGRLIWKYHD
jgi:hypothetical protein